MSSQSMHGDYVTASQLGQQAGPAWQTGGCGVLELPRQKDAAKLQPCAFDITVCSHNKLHRCGPGWCSNPVSPTVHIHGKGAQDNDALKNKEL